MGIRVGQVPQLKEMLGYSESSLYRLSGLGLMPKPFKLLGKTVWDLDEIDAWLAAAKAASRNSVAVRDDASPDSPKPDFPKAPSLPKLNGNPEAMRRPRGRPRKVAAPQMEAQS